jgi:hypothetical protein
MSSGSALLRMACEKVKYPPLRFAGRFPSDAFRVQRLVVCRVDPVQHRIRGLPLRRNHPPSDGPSRTPRRLQLLPLDSVRGRVPRRPACLAYVGLAVTTLGIMGLLLVVSFSMAALSNEQPTSDLRARAPRDGMTGLLNGAGFLRLATAELRRHSRGGAKSKAETARSGGPVASIWNRSPGKCTSS